MAWLLPCLTGAKRRIGEALYEKIKEMVREEINPRDSWRASKEFRLQIGGEIAARALRETVKIAGGEPS